MMMILLILIDINNFNKNNNDIHKNQMSENIYLALYKSDKLKK